jgi:thiol-disulfide isomerase/thioredoxin
MRRGKWLAITLAILPGVLAAAPGEIGLEGDAERRSRLAQIQGKPAPELEVQRWLGKPLKMAELKGKVVLIDFWGTWCGPCRAAIPHVKELAKKHADRGLVVIGLHTVNAGETVEEFVKKNDMTYPVAVDAAPAGSDRGKTVTAYMVDSFPDYYLIDRKGILRYADVRNPDVDAAVEQLLAEK